jgi:hypothetical protein
VEADGETIIEGCAGSGEDLMLSERHPEPLPARIVEDVLGLFKRAAAALGPVRFEWVHDSKRAWIVQLHRGAAESTLLRPSEASNWIEFDVGAFDVRTRLPALHALLEDLPRGTGLILKPRVGMTSHVVEAIRRARVPAKMAD